MKEGNIKLADFGLSVLAEREIFAEELRIGTPRYMAPEILRQGIYSYKGDVWSLGSLFIEMITG
jgi:serine/threonine protein kinase